MCTRPQACFFTTTAAAAAAAATASRSRLHVLNDSNRRRCRRTRSTPAAVLAVTCTGSLIHTGSRRHVGTLTSRRSSEVRAHGRPPTNSFSGSSCCMVRPSGVREVCRDPRSQSPLHAARAHHPYMQGQTARASPRDCLPADTRHARPQTARATLAPVVWRCWPHNASARGRGSADISARSRIAPGGARGA